MSTVMSSYRVKRPKKYNELLDLLRHKEEGVFDSLKSALIFAAGIGFKNGMKSSFVETGEPIGIKRLMARPVATLSIEAQEKHERNEKIFIDD